MIILAVKINFYLISLQNEDLTHLLEDNKCDEYEVLTSANGLSEGKRFKELEDGPEPTKEEIENFREYCEEMIGFECEHWSKIWSGGNSKY